MRVISRRKIRDYWEGYDGADKAGLENALKAWFQELKAATWVNANQVKEKYRSASVLKNGRVVFNICGNKFRIITKIDYSGQLTYIRWVGTHKEYDSISAEEV